MAGMLITAIWLQDSSAISADYVKYLTIFVGLVALAMLIQAIAVAVIAAGAMKAIKSLMVTVNEVKAKALPLIDQSQGLYKEMLPKVRTITDNVSATTAIVKEKTGPMLDSAQELYKELQPKIRTIADNVTETTTVVKDKIHLFEGTLNDANETVKSTLAQLNETVKAANATALDVNERARGQIAHVDEMVTGLLNKTTELSAVIQRGLGAPARAISNVAAGVKGGFESLVQKMKPERSASYGSPRTARPVNPVPRATPTDARPVSTMRDLSPGGRDIDL